MAAELELAGLGATNRSRGGGMSKGKNGHNGHARNRNGASNGKSHAAPANGASNGSHPGHPVAPSEMRGRRTGLFFEWLAKGIDEGYVDRDQALVLVGRVLPMPEASIAEPRPQAHTAVS